MFSYIQPPVNPNFQPKENSFPIWFKWQSMDAISSMFSYYIANRYPKLIQSWFDFAIIKQSSNADLEKFGMQFTVDIENVMVKEIHENQGLGAGQNFFKCYAPKVSVFRDKYDQTSLNIRIFVDEKPQYREEA